MSSDPTESLSIEALRTPPEHVAHIRPALRTNLQELYWDDYDWKDFERLSLRLLEREYEVENVRLYGRQGEDQQGIDIIGRRRGQTKNIVLQAKRNKAFTASDIREVAAQFLHIDKDGKDLPPLSDEDGHPLPLPKDLVDTFILAVSCRLDMTKLSAAWSALERDLHAKGITAILWDQSAIELRLKKRPEIVQDFFGMAYVDAFCGAHEAAKLRGTAGHADIQGVRNDIANVVATLQDIQGNGLTLAPDLLAELRTLVSAPVAAVAEPQVVTTDPTENLLNTVRTLVEAGAGDAALDQLTQLEAHTPNLTPAQQSTIHRLCGHVWYRRGDSHQAAPLFHQAYRLDPTTPASQIAEGLAWLINGHPARAAGILDLVRLAHPDREDARSLYLIATAQQGPSPELDALEAALTPDDDASVINLARHYSNHQDTAAMRRVLTRLDGGPHEHDPHRRLLGAKADLLDLMAEQQGVMPEVRALTLQRRPEVRQLLTTIADILPALQDARQNRALAPEALNVAQVVHSLLGEEDAAIEQGRQALALSRDEHGIRVDVALSYLRLGRPMDAARELQTGGEALLAEYPDSRPILAAALRLSGHLDQALAILTPQLAGQPTTGLLDERVRILLAEGHIEQARQALTGAPNEMQTHLIRADIEQAAGDDEATRLAYEDALKTAPTQMASFVRLLYAQYLGSKKAFPEAATLLEPLALDDLPSSWLHLFLILTHNADRPTDKIIAALDDRGDLTDLTSLHIAILVAAQQGDFQRAIQWGETFLRQRPREAHVLLTLADLYVRIAQPQAARRHLERLQVHAVTADLLTYAAQIARRLNNRPLACELSYQAYRRGTHEDAYFEFLREMLDAPDEPDPDEVRAETAVQLHTASRPDGWWVILTRDPHPDLSKGEHAAGDAFAQTLLGRRVGDTVIGGPEDLTVSAIHSKYTHAVKNVFSRAHELFPTSGRLRHYAVGPLEVLPTGLWDILRKRDESIQKLTTVTSVDHQDFMSTAQAIAAAPTVMLDPSALVVLNRARLLRQLPKTHQVLVTRQTLDDINVAVMDVERELKRAPLKSMHYEGGRIVLVEEDIAVTQRRLHFLKGIQSFIRKYTRVVPVIEMGRGTPSSTSENAATFSTVFGAVQHQVPMLSDDLPWMTHVSQIGRHAPWTTSARFTLAMGSTGRWPTQRVQQALLTFLSLGQTVLPISTDTMKAVLQQEDLNFGHLTRRAIRNVTHPFLEYEFAMRQLSRFIRMAVLQAPLPITRERWIWQALDVAAIERDALGVARGVLDALPRAFYLLQHLLPEIEHTIQTWLNLQLHPQQLVSPSA